MDCPYCLARLPRQPNGEYPESCDHCRAFIPPLYRRFYDREPAVPLTIVGFRGHGKTVYLSSMYLQIIEAGKNWPDSGFNFLPLGEPDLDKLKNSIDVLRKGNVPVPNARMFAEPIILRLRKLPIASIQGRSIQLVVFDTSGENFERADDLQKNARYVAKSPILVWLISVKELETLDLEAFNTTLATTLEQDVQRTLIVVLTKMDEYVDDAGFPEEAKRLLTGETTDLEVINDSVLLQDLSNELRSWMRGAFPNFVNFVTDEFDKVLYLPTSALGGAPTEGRIVSGLAPRGVLLPLLCAIETAMLANH